jgi:hypothetical protein
MATFTAIQTDSDGFALPWDGIAKVGVAKRTVNFATAANYLAQTQVMPIFKVPAKVKIREFGMRVITADTDVTTVDLGVYTRDESTLAITEVDLDGFAVNVSLATTGYVGVDVDAVYNPAGTNAHGYVGIVDSYLCIYNADADTINGANVEFFAIWEDLR